jgi:hypothetical protein
MLLQKGLCKIATILHSLVGLYINCQEWGHSQWCALRITLTLQFPTREGSHPQRDSFVIFHIFFRPTCDKKSTAMRRTTDPTNYMDTEIINKWRWYRDINIPVPPNGLLISITIRVPRYPGCEAKLGEELQWYWKTINKIDKEAKKENK